MRCCQILTSPRTREACALISLHLLAADYEVGSNGSLTQETCGNVGVHRSPIWSSPCWASVTSGDDEEYGHNNECGPLKSLGRIGQVKWWRSFSRLGSSGERH